MKIRSYRCPKCGREYNFADGNKTRLCRVCGCELDSLTAPNHLAYLNGHILKARLLMLKISNQLPQDKD